MGPKTGPGGSSGVSLGKRSAGPRSANIANGRSDAFRQKKAKLFAARNIPAQPADAALKDGQLDLQAFVAAHEFEIRSLEQSMATSRAVGTSRAFQQVPRGLRRRAASHNPKRVPKRLRSRARKEMEEDNTPIVESRRRKPRSTRARIRAETAKRLGILAARKRRKSLKKAEAARKAGKHVAPATPAPAKFRKRQINKTWLPTHKWHAKRARMTDPKNPLWRFAIPLTPTEKIYRATHRAQGERGAMAWDTSYMSTIGLYGSICGITKILKAIGVTEEYSMIVWNPEPSSSNKTADVGGTGGSNVRNGQRQLFIRLSPAAFLETFTEMVRLCKMKGSGVYVEDLRFEIGSIELTGPASTETLLGIITPYHSKEMPSNKHANLFDSLKSVTNSACLPENSVLGFSTQDPRLHYPPRKVEYPSDSDTATETLELLANWPAEEELEPYGLFDRGSRFRSSCLPSSKAINKRRSMAMPGSFLNPGQLDPPIPVLLISTRSPGSMQAQGTWVLLVPWKCILPLWYSLVHYPLVSGMNPRFGGLSEAMQVAFERGMPWFPTDFLATNAGAEWELEQRQKRQLAYNKRPKSKRIAFNTVDLGAGRKGEIGDGLACDFEYLFELPRPPMLAAAEPELVQADKSADPDAMDVDSAGSLAVKGADEKPLHVPSLRLLNNVSRIDFNKFRASPVLGPRPPPYAIAIVRLTLLSRGVARTCARIYRLPEACTPAPNSSDVGVPASMPPHASPSVSLLPKDLRSQWLSKVPCTRTTAPQRSRIDNGSRQTDMQSRIRRFARDLIAAPEPYPPPAPNQASIGGHPLVPDAGDLIGFVTSGSFCLRAGTATAFGSIAVEKALRECYAGQKVNAQDFSPQNGGMCVGATYVRAITCMIPPSRGGPT
ncbi:uncharacterized protein UV8b_04492 [Ustilaginoidea virens]|uniref:Uncharacterized protein n=1 Tax=Ustilaginoidea virens TaxID=1159556 RepID=A0A8E5MHS5_USTVR|nr:uncharacterized protein UV8b_04492 [Ustilaginoidea virens]QUC20251.1 hypothetical protein UV8b_04492 [Ustilaginoidea virens]